MKQAVHVPYRKAPPGGTLLGAAICSSVFAAIVGFWFGMLRFAAFNGPADDVDRAWETKAGNVGLAAALALLVLAVALLRASARRRRSAVDA